MKFETWDKILPKNSYQSHNGDVNVVQVFFESDVSLRYQMHISFMNKELQYKLNDDWKLTADISKEKIAL